ncbi:chondroadherin-like isoform X2 [Chironomus tepperi]|uniref:chondroadherin-like isoform X2 n=1 Tax=Chironomus tepperi TaxID=113505 RepID=UPI00391EF7F2
MVTITNIQHGIVLFTIFLSLNNATSLSKCPLDCYCDLDPTGRYYTECNEPNFSEFKDTDYDRKMEVIIIRDPKHPLTIGPVFSRFKKLETLKIVGANIPAIGERSFWGVTSLRSLDLSFNNITLINTENFYDQKNLVELNLSSNKIGRVPSGSFSYLISLRILNLADNSLKELLPRTFQGLSKLRYLDLSENPLNDLTPNVLRDVKDLRALKCRKCQLKNVNPTLYFLLKQLSELDLGENQLQQIDADEFKDMKYLKQIHLDGNQLSTIVSGLFSSQKSLEYLDLSRNRLRKIESQAFNNLSNLTYLDISYNKLPTLELNYMYHLTKLQTLNISGNVQLNLFEMSAMFQNMSNLRSLSIADITNLPLDIFETLNKLQSLNISGAGLGANISRILQPLIMLKELDISRNFLTGFDEDLVEKLLSIENVYFEHNKIICDVCSVGAMVDRKHLMKWKYMPACNQPDHLRHKQINRLIKENLVACYENLILDGGNDAASTSYKILHESQLNLIAFMGASIFVLLLLIIIISISICTRQRAHYYTREDGKGELLSNSRTSQQ